jgi:hypothetical protein
LFSLVLDLDLRVPHDLPEMIIGVLKFQVQKDEPWRRGEREYLKYGFSADDGNTWVCEDCYYAIKDVLEFTAEVT